MILIISYNQELTTTEVIKWLITMEKKFILVHENELFDIRIIDKKIYLESHRNEFFIDDIKSVWYRRGRLKFKNLKYNNLAVNEHMLEVQYWLQDYVLKTLESKRHINKQSNSSINKLLVLEKAKEVGLNVPEYFLAQDTENINSKETITKTIAEGMFLENVYENINGFAYTSIVKRNEYSKKYYPSFFQKKIEKEFEIRCFYLDKKVWTVAIFSQNDEKTKVDFRNYNYDKPNRNVSYTLPQEIEKKINNLMISLDLNCGSLDFIKSEGKFYFLEINPIGQFLALSNKCNFNLEREIANYL